MRSRKNKNNIIRNIHQETDLEKKPKLRIKDQMRLVGYGTEGRLRDTDYPITSKRKILRH